MKTVVPQGTGGSNPPCSERREEQGGFETESPPSKCEEKPPGRRRKGTQAAWKPETRCRGLEGESPLLRTQTVLQQEKHRCT